MLEIWRMVQRWAEVLRQTLNDFYWQKACSFFVMQMDSIIMANESHIKLLAYLMFI